MNSSAVVSIRLLGGARPSSWNISSNRWRSTLPAGGTIQPAPTTSRSVSAVTPISGWPGRTTAHDRLLGRAPRSAGATCRARRTGGHDDVELALLEALDQHRAGLDLAARRAGSGCSRFTRATAAGSSAIAGEVMAPMLTWPKRPAFSASISSCAWLRLASAMRAWRIMVSPYQVGRTPRGRRSNSAHLQHVLQILEQLGRGRLRHVQHLRGAVDVAFLVQRDEQQQLARLEARADEPVGVRRHGGGFPECCD